MGSLVRVVTPAAVFTTFFLINPLALTYILAIHMVTCMGEVLLNKHSSSTWTAMQPTIIQHMLSSPYAQINSSVLRIHNETFQGAWFWKRYFTFSLLTKPVANMQTPKQSNSFLKCKATNLIMGVIHVPQHTILNLCNQSLLPEYQINNPKNNHSRKSHFRVMSNCSDQLKTCKNLKYKGWNIVWKAIPSSFSGPYVPSHSVAWAVSQIAPGHALEEACSVP